MLLTCVTGINASKKYADLSQVKAEGANGSWNAETKSFGWTTGNDARIVLPGLSGDLSDYTTLVLETADYNGSYRVDFKYTDADGKEQTIKGADGGKGAFGSAGTKILTLSNEITAEQLKTVTKIIINTNSYQVGSITINKAYLVKPLTALDFVNGVATLDLTDITASTATYDDQTGMVTSTGSGSFSISLPSEGIDLSEVSKITVEHEGDDIVKNLAIKSSSKTLGTLFSSKYVLDMTTNSNFGGKNDERTAVTSITWELNSTSGSMTIKSITFTQGFSKITIGESQYATFVTTIPLNFTGSNVKAFAVKMDNGAITYTQLTDNVPAGSPILVYAAAAGTYYVPVASSAGAITNSLHGSATESKEADGTQYILANGSAGLGWYQATSGTTIAAGKAYLEISSNNAKPFYAIGDNTVTAIGSVDIRNTKHEAPAYNLAGQRIGKSYKGIVVKNGRKYIVK